MDSPRPGAENPGAVDPNVDSPRPSAENPGAVDPNVDSPPPSAENPGAVDPKVDSPRPSAENFLPYIKKKIVSAPGRGRSKGGFSAPERRNFSPLYREENRFRARAR